MDSSCFTLPIRAEVPRQLQCGFRDLDQIATGGVHGIDHALRLVAQHLHDFAYLTLVHQHVALNPRRDLGGHLVAKLEPARRPEGVGPLKFLLPAAHQPVLDKEMHRLDDLVLEKRPQITDKAHTAPPHQELSRLQTRIGPVVAHIAQGPAPRHRSRTQDAWGSCLVMDRSTARPRSAPDRERPMPLQLHPVQAQGSGDLEQAIQVEQPHRLAPQPLRASLSLALCAPLLIEMLRYFFQAHCGFDYCLHRASDLRLSLSKLPA